MPRSRSFQVIDGRILFKCPSCRSKKRVSITPGIRRRSVFCQKCGEKTFCVFDRRGIVRTNQCGRILLLVDSDRVEVNLFDISTNGAGFEMDIRSKLKIEVGKQIGLYCSWNPNLFSRGYYVVRSVRGFKIGVERQY